jgi:hypothetical protein
MKKTRKNMLRSSAAMLLVSALALTTATYAWFTTGNTGKVENLTLTAKTADGIQLSVDAQNWKSTITETELTNISTNQMLNKTENDITTYGDVLPLSSTGAVSDGSLVLYQLTQNPDTGYVTTVSGTTGGENVMRFDFYVKNDNSEKAALDLDFETGNVSTVENKNTKSTKSIQNAVRVAFIKQGEVTINSNGYVTKALQLKTENEVADMIWEPNSTANVTTYAINAAIPDNKCKLSDDGVIANSGNATSYIGVQSTFKDTTLADKVTSKNIANIGGNSISKFTVYVWFEGQDVDCTNQNSGDAILINLKFVKGEAITGN